MGWSSACFPITAGLWRGRCGRCCWLALVSHCVGGFLLKCWRSGPMPDLLRGHFRTLFFYVGDTCVAHLVLLAVYARASGLVSRLCLPLFVHWCSQWPGSNSMEPVSSSATTSSFFPFFFRMISGSIPKRHPDWVGLGWLVG